jgi:hypothetical protein
VSNHVVERLRMFVDEDNDSDWEDVKRRLPRHRRRSRPVLLIAAALIVLAAAAAPALAFQLDLLPWFRGEPASQAVTERLTGYSTNFRRTRPFAAGSPLAGLRPSEARGLIAFDTPFGALRMWRVPTTTGESCVHTEIGGRGRGVFCARPSAETPWAGGYGPLWGNRFVLIEGRAYEDVFWVGVRFVDGSVEALPFVDGFFVAVVDKDRKPAALVMRRQIDGREIETTTPLLFERPRAPDAASR